MERATLALRGSSSPTIASTTRTAAMITRTLFSMARPPALIEWLPCAAVRRSPENGN
jgi:hypothetical protein